MSAAASCPAGLACPSLDILASAGLGLTGLGIKFIITALLRHQRIAYPVPFLSTVWGYILEALFSFFTSCDQVIIKVILCGYFRLHLH